MYGFHRIFWSWRQCFQNWSHRRGGDQGSNNTFVIWQFQTDHLLIKTIVLKTNNHNNITKGGVFSKISSNHIFAFLENFGDLWLTAQLRRNSQSEGGGIKVPTIIRLLKHTCILEFVPLRLPSWVKMDSISCQTDKTEPVKTL